MSGPETPKGRDSNELPSSTEDDELIVVRAIQGAFARADYARVRKATDRVDTRPGTAPRVPFYYHLPHFIQRAMQRGRFQKQEHQISLLRLRDPVDNSEAIVEMNENVTTETTIYNASFKFDQDPPVTEQYCVYVHDEGISRIEAATHITTLAQKAHWIDQAFDAPLPSEQVLGIK